jgi:cytochrome P450/NADPH-cytochrome P450 reductase
MLRWARCPPEQHALRELQSPQTLAAQLTEVDLSILDLLEQFPATRPPLAELLALWPTLSTRRYSISSAPAKATGRCSLTISVLDQAAHSGRGRHRGTASHYLARLRVGDLVPVAVEAGPKHFAPPQDYSTPLILICAGTGFAPFRGFVQEREAARSAGRSLGKALLYFGCDQPDVDLLYAEELRAAEQAGVIELRPTFCRAPRGKQVFVQHRLWEEREELLALIHAGAHVRVCGDARLMAPAVKEAWQRMLQSGAPGTPTLLELERTGRYVADVFS